MDGLSRALNSIIPDTRKGIITSDRPKEDAYKMAAPEVRQNGKKTGPFGEMGFSGNGSSGVMEKLSKYPKLQHNNPLNAINMPNIGLEPALHSTELDANRKLPYQRLVAPMASNTPMKLRRGQILFTHRTCPSPNSSRRYYPFADTTKLGYGNPPSWTVDLVTLNYILLKEQLEMFLDREKNQNYANLDPSVIMKEWKLDGIAEKDSVSASSGNLFEKVILIKASQAECQNYIAGLGYKTGDSIHLVCKKYDIVDNKELDRIFEDCPGLCFKRQSQNIRFRPYQLGAFTSQERRLEPLVLQYEDDLTRLTRSDGLPIYVGRVMFEPTYTSGKSPICTKNDEGKKTRGHALRNPLVGITSETVKPLTILLQTDSGDNVF